MIEIKFIKHHVDTRATDFTKCRTIRALNKVKSLLDALGDWDSEVAFASLPDFSFSLNQERFKFGLGIGGILKWGAGNVPMIPLQIMPNCCGTMCVRLKSKIQNSEIITSVMSTINSRIKS